MKGLSRYLGLLCMLLASVDAAAQSNKAVSCGGKMTTPGTYWLSEDCTGDGIEISASGVRLFLNGHSMTSDKADEKRGIEVSNASDVAIVGPGYITKYAQGIFFQSVKNSTVTGIASAYNGEGIQIFQGSSDNRIKFNYTYHNGSNGIVLSEGTSNNCVEGNFANYNQAGISVKPTSTDNKIHNNFAWENTHNQDLDDGNANCDHNEWGPNFFANADAACIK